MLNLNYHNKGKVSNMDLLNITCDDLQFFGSVIFFLIRRHLHLLLAKPGLAETVYE